MGGGTRAYAVVNYEQAVEPFLKTDRLTDSERAMLMGGACALVAEESLAQAPDRLASIGARSARAIGALRLGQVRHPADDRASE